MSGRADGRGGLGRFAASLMAAAAAACSGSARVTGQESAPSAPAGPRLLPPFISRTLTLPNGEQRHYALFIPPQYNDDPNHRWPVIVFLHGSGECGVDGVLQTTVGLPPHIRGNSKRFPFITIMPQARRMWFRGEEELAVFAILDDVFREYRGDHERIFLTGLSMGGFAAWELAMARPDVFAAIVPVCGAAPKEFAPNIVHLPVWAFHGALDSNVPVAGSRTIVAELRRLGAAPRYTEYADLGHNCWDRAYQTPQLWSWLIKQRRKPPPRTIDYVFPGRLMRAWWLAAEALLPQTGRPWPRIRATLGEGGRVEIRSEGVVSWALVSNGEPLSPGSEIEVVWNDRPVMRGKFEGLLTVQADASQPASQPGMATPGAAPTSQPLSP